MGRASFLDGKGVVTAGEGSVRCMGFEKLAGSLGWGGVAFEELCRVWSWAAGERV
jgi:hypothetical protein